MQQYQPYLKSYARELRKNQTDAEELLWSKLRRRQLLDFRFNRQKPLGPYIVDFYCARAQLTIELDGGQHYTDEGRLRDQKRDSFFRDQKLKILRFSDRDIFENLTGVLEAIYQQLKISPNPSLQKRGTIQPL